MAVEVTLGNTIGAAFLGCIGAAILYGITNLQVFVYYQKYPNDWRFQRISVGVLWFLDSLHLALTIHAVYHYLIDSFGNLAAEEVIFWSFKLQIAVNVVIVLVVQSLYALRVWRLGSHFSRVWPWVVIVSVAGGYAVGILLAVETYAVNTFAALQEIKWAIYSSFATSTAIDIIIAVAICFYLQRSRSGFTVTNFKIVTIMKYVVVSGFLTSACSTTALITFGALPNTLVFLGIEFLLTKLYINSFIAMLNARKNVRDKDTTMTSASKLMTNLSAGQRQGVESTPTTPIDDDKNIIGLLPLAYRSDFTPQRKPSRSRGGDSTPSFGITVHRSVEMRTDSVYPYTHAV